MNEEEIEKLFCRIELDKSSDSCGFEFADGFGCTFDNIATCYDDRLRLYDLAKHYKHIIDELEKWLEEEINIYDETRKMHEEYSVPEERCNAKYYTSLKTLNKLQELKVSDKK